MATITIYNTYRFKNKDPIIDKLRTAMQDEKMSYKEVSANSGVSETTLRNWFEGGTRRPQFATTMAAARAMRRDLKLVKLKANA